MGQKEHQRNTKGGPKEHLTFFAVKETSYFLTEGLARWSRSQSSDNLRFLKVVEVTPELGGIRFAEAVSRKFMEDGIQQLYFRDVQAWVNIDGVCDDVTQGAYVAVGNSYLAIEALPSASTL